MSDWIDWKDSLFLSPLFLRVGFLYVFSEHWRSNTYSLRHTNGNQLGSNCSIWPLSCLHHIPSPFRSYTLHTLTIKMRQRQLIHFIHQAFSSKLNKAIVIYFIRTDFKKKNLRGRHKTNIKRSRKTKWWIKIKKEFIEVFLYWTCCLCACVYLCVHFVVFVLMMTGQMGNEWPFLPGTALLSHQY